MPLEPYPLCNQRARTRPNRHLGITWDNMVLNGGQWFNMGFFGKTWTYMETAPTQKFLYNQLIKLR